MKYMVFLGILFMTSIGFGATDSMMEDYFQLRMEKERGQGKGCQMNILEQYSQSMASNFQSHQEETNILMGISQKYFDKEQECRNDLGQAMLDLNNEKLRHESAVAQLPNKIEQAKLAHKVALLQVSKECRASSGAEFIRFKDAASSGVITDARGGITALFNRNENINNFQKLFYDDCMAHEDNIAELHILGKKLALLLDEIETDIEISAKTLETTTNQLSFKQDQAVINCHKADEQLQYTERLLRNSASAANSLTKKQSMLGLIGAVNTCVSGPGNPLDVTSSRTPAATTN